MHSFVNSDNIRAEVLFLITKFLEDEGCMEAFELLKEYINSKKILPSRINVLGKDFSNSFSNFDSLHTVPKHMLAHICRKYLDYLNPTGRERIRTLIGFPKGFDFHRSILTNAVQLQCIYPRSLLFRETFVESLHRRLGMCRATLAHRDAIYCMQYDQRGEFLFTGSDDRTIKIWSLRHLSENQSCLLRHSARGHGSEIVELSVSLDNHLLASIDANCSLTIWCLRTAQPMVSFRGSLCNRMLSGLAFISHPQTSKGLNSFCCTKAAAEQDSSDRDVIPSGWIVVTSFGGYVHFIPYRHTKYNDGCTGHGVNIRHQWRCCDVTLLPTVHYTTGPEEASKELWPSVTCVDVSQGGFLTAAGCSDGCIRLYSFVDPRKPESVGILPAQDDRVNSVAFSNLGLKLASGSSDGGRCWLWRYQVGAWRSLTLAQRKRVKCRPCLLVWSKQDRFLIASMKNGSVYIYFGESGRLVTVIEAHEGAIYAVAPSPHAEHILATGGVDGRFQVWNIDQLVRWQNSSENRLLGKQTLPLLFHYRYSASRMDSSGGTEMAWVWQRLGPDDDRPVWPGSSAPAFSSSAATAAVPISSVTRRLARGGQETGSLTLELGEFSHPGSSRASTGAAPASTIPSVASSQSCCQRITVCRSLPAADGVGFVVATRSGWLSAFAPQAFPQNDRGFTSSVWDDNPIVDEQFLHWELDPESWWEASEPCPEDTDRLQTYESVIRALGSPPAPQVRHNSDIRHARRRTLQRQATPEVVPPAAPPSAAAAAAAAEAPSSVSHALSDWSDEVAARVGGRDGAVEYQPPASVLFEVIHEPSRVPHHRLPPGYLVNWRGLPFDWRRQKQIPGRHNLTRRSDLAPTMRVDEETGDEVVVDDIQICPGMPSDYAPRRRMSDATPAHFKLYTWKSYWLSSYCQNQNPMVRPFDDVELQQKIAELDSKYSDEFAFYIAGGDTYLTFGDEYLLRNSGRNTVVMQPCSTEPVTRLHGPPTIHMDGTATATCSLRPLDCCPHELPHLTTAVVTASETVPDQQMPRATDAGGNPSVLDDEDEDEEVADSASEESEWSETIDVDIGWWNRRRRRRQRRHLNLAASAAAAAAAAHSGTSRSGAQPTSPAFTDEGFSPVTVATATTAPSTSNGTSSDQRRRRRRQGQARGITGSRIQCGQSILQRHRLITKRRLIREKRMVEVARLEAQRGMVRRSLRSQRDADRDGGQTLVNSSGGGGPAEVLQQANGSMDGPQPAVAGGLGGAEGGSDKAVESVSVRRERLRRRLVKTFNYGISNSARLPLTRLVAGGYTGPHCEGHVYMGDAQRLDPANGPIWDGPHFDWLSTYHPVATPYVPQLGDCIVYIVRGHRDYVRQVWGADDSFPVLLSDPERGPMVAVAAAAQSSLPWLLWPDIPAYLCAEVVGISYHIVRTTNVCLATGGGLDGQAARPTRGRSRHEDKSKVVGTSTRSQQEVAGQPQSLSQSLSPVSQQQSLPVPGEFDSFVRLVSLRLRLPAPAEQRSYTRLAGSGGDSDAGGDHWPFAELQVAYHDVDGVLDFIVLQRLFDAALRHRWHQGDTFICPVGEAWWQGRVLQCPSQPITDAKVDQSCESTAAIGSQSDPWLAYTIVWLDNNQPIASTSYSADAPAAAPPDHLSAWDMHPWRDAGSVDPNETVSGRLLYASVSDGLAQISTGQLRLLYGSGMNTNASLSESVGRAAGDSLEHCITRLTDCFTKLAQLPVSESFRDPVDLTAYPDYLFVNPHPVDLSYLLARLATGFYRQTAAVLADLDGLLGNTLRYNLPDSQIVHQARQVHSLAVRAVRLQHWQSSDLEAEFHRLSACSPPAGGDDDQPTGNSSSAVVDSCQPDVTTGRFDCPASPASSSSCVNDQSRRSPGGPRQQPRRNRRPYASASQLAAGRVLHRKQRLVERASRSTLRLAPTQRGCPQCTLAGSHLYRWGPIARSLVRSLVSHKKSYFFRQPINTSLYPDYQDRVSRPMDLATVHTRLERTLAGAHSQPPDAVYRCPHDLVSDLSLIVSNSRLYNRDPQTLVYDDTLWLDKWIRGTLLPGVLGSPAVTVPNQTTCGIEDGSSSSRSLAGTSASRLNLSAPPSRHCRSKFSSVSVDSCRSTRRADSQPASSSLASASFASDSMPSPAPLPSLRRTSSGRVVRPPPRMDSQPEFHSSASASSSSGSSSEERSNHRATVERAQAVSHVTRKRKRMRNRRLPTPAPLGSTSMPVAMTSAPSADGELRRSKRQRCTAIATSFYHYFSSSDSEPGSGAPTSTTTAKQARRRTGTPDS